MKWIFQVSCVIWDSMRHILTQQSHSEEGREEGMQGEREDGRKEKEPSSSASFDPNSHGFQDSLLTLDLCWSIQMLRGCLWDQQDLSGQLSQACLQH